VPKWLCTRPNAGLDRSAIEREGCAAADLEVGLGFDCRGASVSRRLIDEHPGGNIKMTAN
jgi:hypothetical protein